METLIKPKTCLVHTFTPASMVGFTYGITKPRPVSIEELRSVVFTDCSIENMAVRGTLKKFGVKLPVVVLPQISVQTAEDTFYVILDQNRKSIWKYSEDAELPSDVTITCLEYKLVK